MPRRREQSIEHLLRRASFGASQAQVDQFADIGFRTAVNQLIDYEDEEDDVDDLIGKPGTVGITARTAFLPAENITDARQRWLFRMVHSSRPLQEKMALFWHNHFATAYSKISGVYGGLEATRMLAAKESEHPAGIPGQLELFRKHALGNFRDLLVAVAQDVAMLVWLDGRTNVRNRPQENFARELMELFTMGVGTFEESDVYAGARVFTGWNLSRVGGNATTGYYRFNYAANQHDTAAKEFSFPIYPDGNRRIAARSDSQGMQDGIDMINAVARHPATGPRLVRKLYQFFVNEIREPDPGFVQELSRIYYDSNFEMKPVITQAAQLGAFQRPATPLRALLVARRVRRPFSQGSGMGGILGERRADAVNQHGSAALRAAGRQRVGPGAWLVLERCDAGAHELRRAARDQSEVQPA